jgi:micrococcal nuclease
MYTYTAMVVKVVDGDTLQLMIDLGFRMTYRANCRLNGLNTMELNSNVGDERLEAIRSKEFLEDNCPTGSFIKIISKKLDKYGRPLVDIYNGDIHLNELMIKEGYAKPYNL